MIITFIVIILIFIVFILISNYEYDKKKKLELKEAEREEKLYLPSRISQYNTLLNQLYLKHGKPVANIYIPKSSIHNNIFDLSLNIDETTNKALFGMYGNLPEIVIENSFIVFENSSTLFIENKPYHFKDIINFNVCDNSEVLYSGNATSSTETKSGSMIGRAVVGGVLLGGAGAIIGGTTAKKDSITSISQSSYTIHKYEIIITVNSLSKPSLKLEIGNNQDAMQKISSILSIIIERN